MLTACEVVPGSKDEQEVARLLEEAFPPNERAPLSFLTTQARREEVSLLAYRDEGQFCGFVFMIGSPGLAYVLYLAVDGAIRSKGHGARMLADIDRRCLGKTITLDIEPIDEAASNAAQRKKRRDFYLRNGFEPTGLANCFEDNRYEVLAKGPGFEPKSFLALINELPEGEDKTLAPLEQVMARGRL
ncbi:MAG: GNAT family N-acetyltransferase [Gordonibacter sp.]|uniref:GNAT family N-acetyltransferase n=1 Tax=Gordonibacter sp. TaxID=1968902 RepID=UPI002FCA8779